MSHGHMERSYQCVITRVKTGVNACTLCVYDNRVVFQKLLCAGTMTNS